MRIDAADSGHAHAYYCRTESLDAPQIEAARRMLSREERERHDRCFRAREGRDYVAAHALLRVALAAHVGTAPERLVFAADVHGKPFLVPVDGNAEPRSFSLSHTPGLVACVIASQTALGIDVEAIDRSVRALELARHVFSPDEFTALQGCPGEELPLRFFELWTLKEAFLKAEGAGLAGMSHCGSFHVQGQHVSVTYPSTLPSRQWAFLLKDLEGTHTLAVAMGGTAGRPSVRVVSTDPFAIMNGVLAPVTRGSSEADLRVALADAGS